MVYIATNAVYPPILGSLLPSFEVDYTSFCRTYPGYSMYGSMPDARRKRIDIVAARYFRRNPQLADPSDLRRARYRKERFRDPPTHLVGINVGSDNEHFYLDAGWTEDDEGTVTVRASNAIVLRSPDAFPVLLRYLYTRSARRLLKDLTSQSLREQVMFIRGFWETLFHLKVVDLTPYKVVVDAWSMCLKCMRQVNGSVHSY